MSDVTFTAKQGQYLAFIHVYTKLNGYPPAVADIQRYFEVTPPTAQSMVVRLTRLGLVSRTPRTPRSIRVLVDAARLPPLG